MIHLTNLLNNFVWIVQNSNRAYLSQSDMTRPITTPNSCWIPLSHLVIFRPPKLGPFFSSTFKVIKSSTPLWFQLIRLDHHIKQWLNEMISKRKYLTVRAVFLLLILSEKFNVSKTFRLLWTSLYFPVKSKG